jgi:hypothetical protein
MPQGRSWSSVTGAPAALASARRASTSSRLAYPRVVVACGHDVRFITRLAERAIVAFLSAAIGVISTILVNAGGDTRPITVAHARGYAGLAVATVLGLCILVSITRDRVV